MSCKVLIGNAPAGIRVPSIAKIGLMLAVLGSSSAAASNTPNAETHDANPEKVALRWFSVRAPSAGPWQTHRESHFFEAARSLDGNPEHTFVLRVREFPTAPAPVSSGEKLLKHVTAAANKEQKGAGRFRLQRHSENLVQRSRMACVEYRKRWADRGGSATGGENRIMRARGLICVHPEAARQLVEISYSARDESGDLPLELQRVGRRFLTSLRARGIE